MKMGKICMSLSAFMKLYVQEILCCMPLGCCLTVGRFKEYTKHIRKVKVIKGKCWMEMFVFFQMVWVSGEWCNCKGVCTSVVWTLTVRTVTLLSYLTPVKAKFLHGIKTNSNVTCCRVYQDFQLLRQVFWLCFFLHCRVLSSCLWIRGLRTWNPQNYKSSCANACLRQEKMITKGSGCIFVISEVVIQFHQQLKPKDCC